jgi:hypothetical protein
VRREPALVVAAAPTSHPAVELGDGELDDQLEASPKLWAEMAEAMLLDPPRWDQDGSDAAESSNNWPQGSLWDGC